MEIITLNMLPDGSMVPVGNPVEMELESESNSNDSDSSNNNNQAPVVAPQNYAMEGTLQAISSTTFVVNGLTIYPDNAKVEGELCVGARVEVEGYFAGDGRFIVTKVEAKGSCSSSNRDTENSGSATGSNNDDSSDSNDNSGDSNDHNDDDHNDDNHNDDNHKNDND